MAILFKASSTNETSIDGGSMFPGPPSGTANGDLLLIALAQNSFGGPAPTVPANWVPIITTVDFGGYSRLYYRIASSEPSFYTIDGGGERALTICCYSGVDTTNPIRTSGAPTSGSNATTSPTPAALSGVQANDVVVISYLAKITPSSTWGTPAGGWTSRATTSTGNGGAQVRTFDKLNGTDRPTITNAGPPFWSVLSVALAGPPAGDKGGFFF